MENLLEVRNLSVSFTKEKNVHLLNDISFSIKDNQVMALLGESGSGKTLTGLSIIKLLRSKNMHIDKNSRILYQGKNLLSLPQQKMQSIRGKHISLVPQEPMSSLNPVYTIGNQMTEILTTHTHISQKEAYKKSILMLEELAIHSPEACMKAYPHQLSGGMKQRVLIAMALLCKPKILIADEITTALDASTQIQVLQLLKTLQKEKQVSILLISHNIHVVQYMSDQLSIMYAGQIVESGSTKNILKNPSHPYTQGLLQAIPTLGKRNTLKGIPGTPLPPNEIFTGCRFANRCEHSQSQCHSKKPELRTLNTHHKVRCIIP